MNYTKPIYEVTFYYEGPADDEVEALENATRAMSEPWVFTAIVQRRFYACEVQAAKERNAKTEN